MVQLPGPSTTLRDDLEGWEPRAGFAVLGDLERTLRCARLCLFSRLAVFVAVEQALFRGFGDQGAGTVINTYGACELVNRGKLD